MWSEKPTRSTQVPALPPIGFASPSRHHSLSHPSYKPKYKETPNHSSSFGSNDHPHHDERDHDRLQDLEGRVGSLEQANKALLEELMLVHTDLRKDRSSQDEVIQDMNYLKNKLESRTSVLENQLGQRVARNEADVEANKANTESLLHSTREMEQEVREMKSRVGEMSAELSTCRGVLGQLGGESTKQDVWLKESFAHMRDQLSWLSQKTNSSLDHFASDLERLEQGVTSQHAKLVSKLASDLKVNHSVVCEENERIRGAMENRITVLEKVLHDERESWVKSSNEFQNQVNRKLDDFNSQFKILSAALEELRQDCERGVSAMSSSLSVVASGCDQGQRELSTVLNAEIKMRQKEVERVQSQCERVQEMNRNSVGALREGLLSLEERVAQDKQEAQSVQNDLAAEWQEAGRRLQTDITARVSSLHDHIKALDGYHMRATGEGGTLAPGTHPFRDRDKVSDTVSQASLQYEHLQRMINGEIESLQKQFGQHSDQLSGLTSSLQSLQLRLVGMVQQETSQRFHSILDIKKEMADLQARVPPLLLTTTPGSTLHHLQPPSQRQQLLSNASNISRDQRLQFQERSNNQLSNSTQESSSAAVVSLSVPRPAGVVTKAYSPFPDAGAVESYMSEEEESESENESEEEEGGEGGDGGMYPDQGGTSHSYVHNRMSQRVRDQFETSPEPHSLQSSITENAVMTRSRIILRQQQQARGRPSRSQRHRTRQQSLPHPLVQARNYYDDPETQGTFTSAPPTPASQQRVLVMGPVSHDGEVEVHSDNDGQFDIHSDDGGSGSHSHDGELGSHSHDEELGSHSHDVELGSHSHDGGLGSHSHDVEYGAHSRDGGLGARLEDSELSSDELDSENEEKATDHQFEITFETQHEESCEASTAELESGETQPQPHPEGTPTEVPQHSRTPSVSDGEEPVTGETLEKVAGSEHQDTEHCDINLTLSSPLCSDTNIDVEEHISASNSVQQGDSEEDRNGTDHVEQGGSRPTSADEMVLEIS